MPGESASSAVHSGLDRAPTRRYALERKGPPRERGAHQVRACLYGNANLEIIVGSQAELVTPAPLEIIVGRCNEGTPIGTWVLCFDREPPQENAVNPQLHLDIIR